MFSGGKKWDHWPEMGQIQSLFNLGKWGKNTQNSKKKKKKKEHPYNFLKLNFRAGPALPINKRFWIKFYYARTYFL